MSGLAYFNLHPKHFCISNTNSLWVNLIQTAHHKTQLNLCQFLEGETSSKQTAELSHEEHSTNSLF